MFKNQLSSSLSAALSDQFRQVAEFHSTLWVPESSSPVDSPPSVDTQGNHHESAPHSETKRLTLVQRRFRCLARMERAEKAHEQELLRSRLEGASSSAKYDPELVHLHCDPLAELGKGDERDRNKRPRSPTTVSLDDPIGPHGNQQGRNIRLRRTYGADFDRRLTRALSRDDESAVVQRFITGAEGNTKQVQSTVGRWCLVWDTSSLLRSDRMYAVLDVLSYAMNQSIFISRSVVDELDFQVHKGSQQQTGEESASLPRRARIVRDWLLASFEALRAADSCEAPTSDHGGHICVESRSAFLAAADHVKRDGWIIRNHDDSILASAVFLRACLGDRAARDSSAAPLLSNCTDVILVTEDNVLATKARVERLSVKTLAQLLACFVPPTP